MDLKRAVITGITGQDGSYLAELLLGKGYEVHGFVRRTSLLTRSRIDPLHGERGAGQGVLFTHYTDLIDQSSLLELLHRIQPDEIYNLAAQSHVQISFEIPAYTYEVTGLGVFRMLDAAQRACPDVRFYQAGSSEMFGMARHELQSEATPFHPVSPYGIAKVAAHHIAVHYREAHGMFVVNGILFNHESPRRGENFVTRKIAMAAARIAAGLADELLLGRIDPMRDWGYAPEYVQAMWQMLQQPMPEDYVIATGETHSVEDFLDLAFRYAGLDWHQYVRHDPSYERPLEVDRLCGDASKARRKLGWQPHTGFKALVELMVEHELAHLR